MIMKRIIFLMFFALVSVFTYAQAPESFSYQAVVRDASGVALINQPVGVQISLIQGALPGTPVYVESYAISSNGLGMINLAIGTGLVQNGDIQNIDWSNGPYYMNVSIDIAGGTAYSDMGTVQLLSVPFALYAKSAGNTFSGDYNDLTSKPTLSGDVSGNIEANSVDRIRGMNVSSNIPANGQVLKWNNVSMTWEPQDDQLGAAGTTDGVVTGATVSGSTSKTLTLIRSNGLGDITAVFSDEVDDADADPSNEIQSLSLAGNDLSISGSNTVTLPQLSYTAGNGIDLTNNVITNTATDQLVTLVGAGATTITGTYPNFTISSTDNSIDPDSDPSNEIQTLTVNGNDLTISNGNSVTLPQMIYTSGTGIGVSGTVITNTAPDQEVSLTEGTGITISGNYPDFVVTNTAPDQNVILTGTGATSVTGTYPNFTISSTDANTTYSAGTGISLSGTQFSHNAHSGDVSGTTALTVTGMQGRSISTNIPANGQVLKWNSTTSKWEPNDDALGAAGTNDGVVTSASVTGTSTKTLTLTRSEGLGNITATFNDAGSVYTAGTGIDVTGTTITNTAPDQTVSLSGSGSTTVSGTYPNFTINSIDNNTTYSAGSGLSLSGTTFSSTQNLTQTLANGNSAGTYSINMNSQNITGANILGLRSNNAAYIDMYYGHIYDYSGSHGIEGQVLRVHGTSPNTYVTWDNPSTLFTAGTGVSITGNTLNTVWSVNGTHIYNNNTGNVGVGLNVPNARLTVKGSSTAANTEPLFEIKNRTGQTVFIVYEDSVRIYVDDDPAKSNKGAFAVSGRNSAKAITNDFLVVTPDRTRIFTGDTINGFGIGNLTGTVADYIRFNTRNYHIGMQAGGQLNTANTNNAYNLFVGHQAGFNTVTGNHNTFIGYQAGYSCNQGPFPYQSISNVYIGYRAGYANTYGAQNVYIGTSAGGTLGVGGSDNVYIGNSAGLYGNMNVVIGSNATCGQDKLNNVILGYSAKANGSQNVVIGRYAGLYSAGNGSVFIGDNAGRFETNSNRFYLSNASVTDYATGLANTLMYGEFDNKKMRINGYLGIGITPSYPIHVVDVTASTNNAAIYATHNVTDGYGTGVEGQGDYTAIRGYSTTTSTSANYAGRFSCYQYDTGTAYGVYGYSYKSTSGTAYGVYGGVSASFGTAYAGYFAGNVHVTGTLSKAGGTFRIDHPSDPENKYLNHSFVESPEMKNVYDGVVVLDAAGEAVVELPSYFDVLNENFRYQLTAIGQSAALFIKEEIANNKFTVAGGQPGQKISWQVTGIRKDPWAKANPVLVEEDKKPEERGKYLNPEVWGKGKEKMLFSLPTEEKPE
ncbi:MAG: hypothetical protein CVU05_03080 [Bacteroidetes bacterium HGW-Bacteroidetes-21]|nr:MAG: hypothetical protein CVU05_03080 [Bacteroidetes bacterium HGW-Bacteroidetes-21]